MATVDVPASGCAQTPRERVLAALAHQTTARSPFSWGFGPTGEMTAVLQRYYAEQGVEWGALRRETDDIVRLSPKPLMPPTGNIWGIHTQRTDYGYRQLQ